MITLDLWRNSMTQRVPCLSACVSPASLSLVTLSPDFLLTTYSLASLYAESVNDYNAYVSNSK